LILQRNETSKTILIPCECWTESVEITRADWNDGTDYYIHFKVDCFAAGQGIFAVLKNRLKFAWQALRKGTYIHEEIIVTRQSLQEIQSGIDELIKEPDIDHGCRTTTI
jgi:hypothetical protein